MIVKGATVTYHHPKSDKKCEGDYYEVDIQVRFNDTTEIAMQYGDYYHDKGSEKIQGFLDCLECLTGKKVYVITHHVADLDWE